MPMLPVREYLLYGHHRIPFDDIVKKNKPVPARMKRRAFDAFFVRILLVHIFFGRPYDRNEYSNPDSTCGTLLLFRVVLSCTDTIMLSANTNDAICDRNGCSQQGMMTTE
jgi:hypothetical protein